MDEELFELIEEDVAEFVEQQQLPSSHRAGPCTGMEAESFVLLNDSNSLSDGCGSGGEEKEDDDVFIFNDNEENYSGIIPTKSIPIPQPVVAKPDVAKPIIAKPVVAKPSIVKPVVAKPVVAKPIIVKPVVTKPAAIKTEEVTQPCAKRTRVVEFLTTDSLPLSSSLCDVACNQIQPKDFHLLPGFFSLDQTISQLTRCLRNAYDTNQGVNVLLIGHHGTGKTHALRAALHRVPYTVIELDGRQIADDAMAARELSRLLCLSHNAVVNQSIASLDTDLQDVRDQFSIKQRGSFSDHLRLVLAHVAGPTRLLFLLKNFDGFCERRKHSFLYTLLDQAHQAEGKFALVAEYCELDCMQRLDKRLRSRLENVTEFHFPARAVEAGEMIQLFASRLSLPMEMDGSKTWNQMVCRALEAYRSFLSVQIQLGQSVGYFLSEVLLGAVMQQQQHECVGTVELDLERQARSRLEHPQSTKIKNNLLGKEELVLLFTAVYLHRMKKMTEFSFETLYKHSSTIRKGGAGVKDMFVMDTPKQNISFVQFESLLAGRYLTRRHKAKKDELQTKALVSMSYSDVDLGLLRYVMDSKTLTFPLPLLYWAKQLAQV
ncbi:hypothetical protein BASA81_002759 [Batrachochytrium salamandrivorans]|nr:hypothetical protein BASA81_002759 [Batrachochytrium salamandrivorans]